MSPPQRCLPWLPRMEELLSFQHLLWLAIFSLFTSFSPAQTSAFYVIGFLDGLKRETGGGGWCMEEEKREKSLSPPKSYYYIHKLTEKRNTTTMNINSAALEIQVSQQTSKPWVGKSQWEPEITQDVHFSQASRTLPSQKIPAPPLFLMGIHENMSVLDAYLPFITCQTSHPVLSVVPLKCPLGPSPPFHLWWHYSSTYLHHLVSGIIKI